MKANYEIELRRRFKFAQSMTVISDGFTGPFRFFQLVDGSYLEIPIQEIVWIRLPANRAECLEHNRKEGKN